MDRLRLTRNHLHFFRLNLPASKSISNRLLVMNALAGTETKFKNLSTSEDTARMVVNLKGIKTCGSSRIPLVIDAGNAGTVFRFLTAMLALTKGKWLLTGDNRMTKRPVSELVEALHSLGASIEYASADHFPPLLIKGKELQGSKVEIDPSKSSQFVTALMLIAPYLKDGLEITLTKKVVSEPYIKMTGQLMVKCGIEVEIAEHFIRIKPGKYHFENIIIEPDWSSASYWYETVALVGEAEIFLNGFQKESIQGDSICAELFKKLGVRTVFEKDGIRLKHIENTEDSFEFDFTNYPDLVPALMATCAAKGIPATFHGIGHLQYKESNRIKSLDAELSKIGVRLEMDNNTVRLISGRATQKKIDLIFNTHNDHRIAMCLAPLIAVFENITINDPGVVAKSYPSFWNGIQSAGMAEIVKL